MAGYDGTDRAGARYQIKGRRITSNKSRQLGFIRGLENGAKPFDYLVGVLFHEDFSILRACVVPVGVVRRKSKYVRLVNAWRFMLLDNVWDDSKVRDVTDKLRRQAARSAKKRIRSRAADVRP